MDTNKTYNGWTNYETWAVAFWLDNEQYWQERMVELATEARDNPQTIRISDTTYHTLDANNVLADTIREYVEDPENGVLVETTGLAADLLGAALGEVDWREIAEHYLADLPEVETETEEAETE